LMRLCRKRPHGGVGLLVMGTGVAFSIISDTGITSLGVCDSWYDWKELCGIAYCEVEAHAVHRHLASEYFEWRKTQQWDSKALQRNAQDRLQAVLKELERHHHVENWVVAGGYASEFENGLYSYRIEFLTKSRLHFDPGFIPLVGLIA